MAPTRACLQLSPRRRFARASGELGLCFALPGASALQSPARPKAGLVTLATRWTMIPPREVPVAALVQAQCQLFGHSVDQDHLGDSGLEDGGRTHAEAVT